MYVKHKRANVQFEEVFLFRVLLRQKVSVNFECTWDKLFQRDCIELLQAGSKIMLDWSDLQIHIIVIILAKLCTLTC